MVHPIIGHIGHKFTPDDTDTLTARWRRSRAEVAVGEIPKRLDRVISLLEELLGELRADARRRSNDVPLEPRDGADIQTRAAAT
jgi:hypothetical protein